MSFKRRWIFANTTALFVSYLFYTPIAHGLTGTHGRHLTVQQLIAHTVALVVVALIVFVSQRFLLKTYINISWLRISLSIIIFVTFFWMGYYQELIPDGPDYDILFAYLILGTAMWLGKIPINGHWLATIIAVLSFPFASFIGVVILLLTITGFHIKFDVQTDAHHTIFWLTVGVTTGLLGGWISGMALWKILKKQRGIEENHS
ncbi:MAG: hypothetical protein SFU87_08900 [Chitinophagaceae bacterium]|nr:hypothetical protein [Chitinophagaceae bacterium]